MEILAWFAGAALLNAALMAVIMKWQAHRIRGWTIRHGEALGVHARATLAGGVCAFVSLVGMAALPQTGLVVDIGLALAAFFIPYYFWLRHAAYQLAKSQRERGRGVARRNVQDITSATFFTAFLFYGVMAGMFYGLMALAGAE